MELYYYTSTDTMRYILKGGDIYATNIRYMNDSEEYTNGLNEIKLLAENEELQEELKRAESFGVKFTGCIACAEELNLVDKMKEIGLDLYKWGPPLTELIKSGAPLLTI